MLSNQHFTHLLSFITLTAMTTVTNELSTELDLDDLVHLENM